MDEEEREEGRGRYEGREGEKSRWGEKRRGTDRKGVDMLQVRTTTRVLAHRGANQTKIDCVL